MSVGIGGLRTIAELQDTSDADDGAGGLTRSFISRGRLFVQITAHTGESRLIEGRQEQSVTHLVRLRWRSDLRQGMRFVIGSRILGIHSVFDADERKRFATCRCEEIST